MYDYRDIYRKKIIEVLVKLLKEAGQDASSDSQAMCPALVVAEILEAIITSSRSGEPVVFA